MKKWWPVDRLPAVKIKDIADLWLGDIVFSIVIPDRYKYSLQLALGDRVEVTDDWAMDDSNSADFQAIHLKWFALACRPAIQIEVARVNPKAPQFHSLLCHATVNNAPLTPFNAPEYQTYPTQNW